MKRDVALALVLGALASLAAIGLVAFQRTDRPTSTSTSSIECGAER